MIRCHDCHQEINTVQEWADGNHRLLFIELLALKWRKVKP